jgi:hypothetical protein
LEQKTETKGEVTVKGQKIPYKVTATTQPVWDEDGKAIAALFYVYYERTDVTNKETRPLVISFNGGPGTASVWMHLGYTGPKKLKIDDKKVLYSINEYGNTSSLSIPLTLSVNSHLLIGKNLKILCCGFGVGLSWGSALLNINDKTIFKNILYV